MYFLYTKNHPLVLFFTPILVVGFLLLQAYFTPPSDWMQADFGWFGNIQISFYSSLTINAVLICINALLLNWIFNTYEFLDRNTYVPSLIYISLIAFFDSAQSLSGATLAQTFILLGLHNIYALNQQDDARKKAFNLGLFVGIAICLVPAYFPLAPLSFMQLWTFRPFRFKEFILLLFGMITPLFYAFYISLFSAEIKLTDVYIHVDQNIYRTILQYLPIAIIALSMLFAWSGIRSRLQKGTVRIRRIIRALQILLLLGIYYIVTDLMFSSNYSASVVIAIPITFGLSLASTHNKLSRFTLPFLYLVLMATMIKFFT